MAAPPVDGAANAAVVRFLADQFGVPPYRVRIVSGARNRRKRVLVEGCSAEQAAAALLA